MYHYTYRITNKVENKHYYGSRSCKNLPKDDLGKNYFSSSRDKEFIKDQKSNTVNYKYKVIQVYTTKEKALALEIKLHHKFNVGANLNFYNRAKQTSTKWCTTGVRMKNFRKYEVSKETREKLSKALQGNKNHLGKTHSQQAKDKVSVANIGNKYNLGKTHSTETKEKISRTNKGRFVGSKHALSKLADVYCNKTGNIIAFNITINEWAKENGYNSSGLSATSRADRDSPSTSKNPHHHKGVYIKYKDSNNEISTKGQ